MTKNNLAPLRDIDDFLLSSARFQLPNYRDLDKWSNRVIQNLLYYQTNYILMGICIILLVSIFNPVKMIYGILAFFVLMGLLGYLRYPTSTAARFRREHPFVGVVLALFCLSSTYYLFSHLLTFLFALLLPVAVMFIHASLRLRNLKNKISNLEREISGKTPMGVILEMLESITSSYLQHGTVTTSKNKFKNKLADFHLRD